APDCHAKATSQFRMSQSWVLGQYWIGLGVIFRCYLIVFFCRTKVLLLLGSIFLSAMRRCSISWRAKYARSATQLFRGLESRSRIDTASEMAFRCSRTNLSTTAIGPSLLSNLPTP